MYLLITSGRLSEARRGCVWPLLASETPPTIIFDGIAFDGNIEPTCGFSYLQVSVHVRDLGTDPLWIQRSN